MTTRTLTGYIARTTDKAVAFVASQHDTKALWLPLKKITKQTERDVRSVPVKLDSNSVPYQALPVWLEVDEAFLTKIGA